MSTQKTPLILRGLKSCPYTSPFSLCEIVLEIKTADNHAPVVHCCYVVSIHRMFHDCPPFLKFILNHEKTLFVVTDNTISYIADIICPCQEKS